MLWYVCDSVLGYSRLRHERAARLLGLSAWYALVSASVIAGAGGE